jgi:hypothetical protein
MKWRKRQKKGKERKRKREKEGDIFANHEEYSTTSAARILSLSWPSLALQSALVSVS